ncbi:hypothetical protein SAMN04488057_104173 [Cyclobacterium lianum]|uniref:Uncharacterized protein n=1 Tax=Cyclobacterium lianum TaxID=388280 RepID=A0A1M7MAM9_9BACT|nr:hypothetical protein SAMN04488057_104173 [Cyclobacterium lianum]
MAKKQSENTANTEHLSALTNFSQTNRALTRREMLGITGMVGLATLTGITSGTVAQTVEKPPLSPFWSAIGGLPDRMQIGLLPS